MPPSHAPIGCTRAPMLATSTVGAMVTDAPPRHAGTSSVALLSMHAVSTTKVANASSTAPPIPKSSLMRPARPMPIAANAFPNITSSIRTSSPPNIERSRLGSKAGMAGLFYGGFYVSSIAGLRACLGACAAGVGDGVGRSWDGGAVDDVALGAADLVVWRGFGPADELQDQHLGLDRNLHEPVMDRAPRGERRRLTRRPEARGGRVLERGAADAGGDVNDVPLRLGSLIDVLVTAEIQHVLVEPLSEPVEDRPQRGIAAAYTRRVGRPVARGQHEPQRRISFGGREHRLGLRRPVDPGLGPVRFGIDDHADGAVVEPVPVLAAAAVTGGAGRRRRVGERAPALVVAQVVLAGLPLVIAPHRHV